MNGRQRIARHACLLLAFALWPLAGGAFAQQDKITLKDGKERTVKITSEDYDGLWYSAEGGSVGLRWKEVDSIRYGGAEKYYKALDAVSSGKPADALPLLQELAADTKLRPVLRHNVLYSLGLASERLGMQDQAIATFQELLKSFPKSRYLLDVGGRLLAIHLARGDAAGATSVLESTLAAAKASGMDPGLQAGFGLLRGRILEAQNKFDQATTVFSTTAATSGADPDVILAAKLGVARCAQQSGRAAEAEQRYREIILQDAPNQVLAGAWNGLGDLALQPATAKRDPDGLRDALFAYLRGVVLYVPERGGSSEEHQRALAGAARAFRGLGELESKADLKKVSLERAKQLRDQLAMDYPDSPHLKGL